MRMFHLRRPEQKPLKQQQQQQQQQQKTSEEPRSQPGALYGKEMIGDSFDFDVFSTNLDDTLQVLEEEGLDNASVKDIMFDSLQRNRSSLMTTSISSDTASLTSRYLYRQKRPPISHRHKQGSLVIFGSFLSLYRVLNAF